MPWAKDVEPSKSSHGAGVVNNGTRVTVAFPFSNIVNKEPTEQLRELAAIVGELARQNAARSSAGEAEAALMRRAEALLAELGH